MRARRKFATEPSRHERGRALERCATLRHTSQLHAATDPLAHATGILYWHYTTDHPHRLYEERCRSDQGRHHRENAMACSREGGWQDADRVAARSGARGRRRTRSEEGEVDWAIAR